VLTPRSPGSRSMSLTWSWTLSDLEAAMDPVTSVGPVGSRGLSLRNSPVTSTATSPMGCFLPNSHTPNLNLNLFILFNFYNLFLLSHCICDPLFWKTPRHFLHHLPPLLTVCLVVAECLLSAYSRQTWHQSPNWQIRSGCFCSVAYPAGEIIKMLF
jgi:hypothetical protein